MSISKDIQILIVDDFKTMIRIIEGMLRQLGFHNISEASDGQKALERLKVAKIDLILSDWIMEPMKGFELLKAVRADAATRHIPMILITAESKPENIIAAKQAGVNNYIVKPLTANTLKEKISAVLGAF